MQRDARCFDDEVIVDFPSVAPASIGSAARFSPTSTPTPVRAAIQLSSRDALDGVTVPLDGAGAQHLRQCGGRGETWAESCPRCAGQRQRAGAASAPGHRPGRCRGRHARPFHRDSAPSSPTRIELASSASAESALKTQRRVLVERHVNLLAILWSLWGALAMLVGVSMLLLLPARWPSARPAGEDVGLAASLTAAVFALIGGFALLWGGAHVWAAAAAPPPAARARPYRSRWR